MPESLFSFIRKRRLSLLVEWLAAHMPGEKFIEGDGIKIRRGLIWSIRYTELRNKLFPHRLYVPSQECEPDGAYMAWHWRDHELVRRPWPEGMTQERRIVARTGLNEAKDT